jgi:hypothetical protein
MFENVPFFEHAFKIAKSSNMTTQIGIAILMTFFPEQSPFSNLESA